MRPRRGSQDTSHRREISANDVLQGVAKANTPSVRRCHSHASKTPRYRADATIATDPQAGQTWPSRCRSGSKAVDPTTQRHEDGLRRLDPQRRYHCEVIPNRPSLPYPSPEVGGADCEDIRVRENSTPLGNSRHERKLDYEAMASQGKQSPRRWTALPNACLDREAVIDLAVDEQLRRGVCVQVGGHLGPGVCPQMSARHALSICVKPHEATRSDTTRRDSKRREAMRREAM